MTRKAYIQLHAAILLAAFSSIFGNLVSLDAVLTTWYRMLFACAILLAIHVARRRSISISRRDTRTIANGAILALHWVMFYASIKYANVSVGVVCFCLSSFFTAIIAPLIGRRRFSPVELALSSLTLAGISLIFHFDSSFRAGIIFGVISALLFAIYATLNETANSHGAAADAMRTTMLQMGGGSVALALLMPIYARWQHTPVGISDPMDFLYLALLALACTVAMCTLLNEAQKKISAFTVSISFNLEPIYSIVLAIVIFNEHRMLGASFYAGLLMIAGSLLLQMYHVSRTSRAAAKP